MTIYTQYTRQVAFEGSAEQCWGWLLNQMECYNGVHYYRQWQENGEYFYDCGRVYVAMCDVATAAEIERTLRSVEDDVDLYDNDESDGHLYH